MRQTLRLWMMITFYIVIWILQFNIMSDWKASQYLKEDMEIAIHDAGLFLDQNRLAQGSIVFNKTKAYHSFVKSLEKNTNLTKMRPNSSSFFQNEFKVMSFKVIDDSNTSFPVEYDHPTYDMNVLYSGPTIIAVIETYGPRYFNGERNIIRRATSYTYER